MKYALLIALLLAPQLASAQNLFVVACEDYYPEHESPESTTIIAEVSRDSSGNFSGLSCRAAAGAPSETCNIFDGGCCTCNVTRGFTPECNVTVEYGESTTIARCLNAFPPCYYGDGCEMPEMSTLAAMQAPAVVKRHGKRIKFKRNRVDK